MGGGTGDRAREYTDGMARRALMTLLVILAGCGGGGGGDPDAGGSPTVSCREGTDDGPVLGRIPRDGGCVQCWTPTWQDDDPACVAAYPDLPSGCRAYCGDGMCARYCENECWIAAPDGGCTPGHLDCRYGNALIPCDSTCGEAGGCRKCVWDDECKAELGPTAICQRHCGTCCRPEDGPVDGGHACGCA